MGTNLLVTAIVIVYLLFMLWIGWYSSTKITSNTDFMVAGRRLGPFLMAGTLAATEIGGGSSLGVVQNLSLIHIFVNLAHVRTLEDTFFQMEDGTSVPISRAFYKEAKNAYYHYPVSYTHLHSKSWSKKQRSAHCIRKAVNLLPLG